MGLIAHRITDLPPPLAGGFAEWEPEHYAQAPPLQSWPGSDPRNARHVLPDRALQERRKLAGERAAGWTVEAEAAAPPPEPWMTPTAITGLSQLRQTLKGNRLEAEGVTP